jgi:hypothetical protein
MCCVVVRVPESARHCVPACQQLCRPLALAAQPKAPGRWGAGTGWKRRAGRVCVCVCVCVGAPAWLTVVDRLLGPEGGLGRLAHTLHLCCPLAWATQTRYVSPWPGTACGVAPWRRHGGGSSMKTTWATWWIRPASPAVHANRTRKKNLPPLSSTLLPTLKLGVDLPGMLIIFPGSTGAGPAPASRGRAQRPAKF